METISRKLDCVSRSSSSVHVEFCHIKGAKNILRGGMCQLAHKHQIIPWEQTVLSGENEIAAVSSFLE